MDLPDLKDLGKVIDLCRKKGVSNITIGTLRLELGPEPERVSRQRESGTHEQDPADPYANFPTGELTPEQLMFYSSGGMPENDPVLKAKTE
jgi:hypothetical protein